MRRLFFSLLVLAFVLNFKAPPAASEPHAVVNGVALWHNLSYRDGVSKSCVLDLAMPKAEADTPRAAIVVVHGGGWIEGDKSSFSTVENRVPGNILDFAARGFVAATINYRLAGEAPYPAALEDCWAAIAWLRQHAAEYHLDPERVGAYGNSAGGHLALLLAMAEPPPAASGQSRVRAAVSDSGPIDLVYGHEHNQLLVVIERFLGGPPRGILVEQYRRASPSTYVDDGKLPPLMLIYGGQDEQVDVRTADALVAALGRSAKNDVTYHRLADAGHCPHSLVRVAYLRGAVEDFFVRVLNPKPKPSP
jgi:acetyl esterase/lipase